MPRRIRKNSSSAEGAPGAACLCFRFPLSTPIHSCASQKEKEKEKAKKKEGACPSNGGRPVASSPSRRNGTEPTAPVDQLPAGTGWRGQGWTARCVHEHGSHLYTRRHFHCLPHCASVARPPTPLRACASATINFFLGHPCTMLPACTRCWTGRVCHTRHRGAVVASLQCSELPLLRCVEACSGCGSLSIVSRRRWPPSEMEMDGGGRVRAPNAQEERCVGGTCIKRGDADGSGSALRHGWPVPRCSHPLHLSHSVWQRTRSTMPLEAHLHSRFCV